MAKEITTFPEMTTTERNAIPTPATGMVILNTTTNQFEKWDGAAWAAQIGSGGLPTPLVASASETVEHQGTAPFIGVDSDLNQPASNSIFGSLDTAVPGNSTSNVRLAAGSLRGTPSDGTQAGSAFVRGGSVDNGTGAGSPGAASVIAGRGDTADGGEADLGGGGSNQGNGGPVNITGGNANGPTGNGGDLNAIGGSSVGGLQGALNLQTRNVIADPSGFFNPLGAIRVKTRVGVTSPIVVDAATDYIALSNMTVAGAVQVDLPAGINGQVVIIKDAKGDAAANNITVNVNGADLFEDGTILQTINTNFVFLRVVFNTGIWYKI